MDFFGLVDAIRTYCTANNIYFIYGNDAYLNAQADANTYGENDLILLADFTADPTFASGTVVGVTYSGVLSLGMKREEVAGVSTESTLDETPIQKYDRRLKGLSTSLATLIGALACDNELDITRCSYRFDLNRFDLNADFVAASITFEQ